MRLGVDASPLSGQMTGVGNYILAVLAAIKRFRPDIEIVLFSNHPLTAEAAGLGRQFVSGGGMPGPIWMNAQLVAAANKADLDVFWYSNGYMPVAPPRALPTILTVHDLTYRLAPSTMRWASRQWRGILQPNAVRRATRLVTVSQATATDVERFDGRKADAVIHPLALPLFAPPDEATMARVRSTYSLPARFMLSLGTQEPRKNLESLVGSMLLMAERGIDVPLLVLAGGRGWRDDSLREAIGEGERRGIVRSLGYVDRADLPGLYGLASLFVLASVYEGFGMPVIEAQRCGTPVAVSNIPALVEAAAGHALTFEPTPAGIAQVLSGWAEGRLFAHKRSVATLDDTSAAAAAAAAMLNECMQAVRSRAQDA